MQPTISGADGASFEDLHRNDIRNFATRMTRKLKKDNLEAELRLSARSPAAQPHPSLSQHLHGGADLLQGRLPEHFDPSQKMSFRSLLNHEKRLLISAIMNVSGYQVRILMD